MVLLSGFWPARGLLSGGWPPLGDSDGDDLFGDICLTPDSPGFLDQSRAPGQRLSRTKQRRALITLFSSPKPVLSLLLRPHLPALKRNPMLHPLAQILCCCALKVLRSHL